MSEYLYGIFMHNRLGTSYRLSLYNQWQSLLVDDGLTELEAHVERARAHDQDVQALEVQWRVHASAGKYGPETVALSRRVMHALAGTHEMIRAQMRGLSAGHPVMLAGERIVSGAFPLGVKALVTMPFVELAAEVERILEQFDGPLADAAAFVHLSGQIDRLRALGAVFRTAVDEGNRVLTFAEVRAAQNRGLSYVAELLVKILAVFNDTDAPDAVAARERYLALWYAQEERQRMIKRARRRGTGPSGTEQPDAVPSGTEQTDTGQPAVRQPAAENAVTEQPATEQLTPEQPDARQSSSSTDAAHSAGDLNGEEPVTKRLPAARPRASAEVRANQDDPETTPQGRANRDIADDTDDATDTDDVVRDVINVLGDPVAGRPPTATKEVDPDGAPALTHASSG